MVRGDRKLWSRSRNICRVKGSLLPLLLSKANNLFSSQDHHGNLLSAWLREFGSGRKAMTNLDSILKSRDITLPTKVRIVKAMVFPVVMYGSESWTIKKADRQIIDAFELWCWRRLLRVPWTARRSNLSFLKEISPECSLEGQILKLRLQYFGHLMRREDSLEKTLVLGKMEGTRRRGRQRTRWLDTVLEGTSMSLTKLREAVEDRSAWRALVHGVTKSRTRLND
uniref:Reverse transcriptase domain-containing protein n=1 Tax=Podarcis muralis TaxID=64176 RepID=A0A670HX80_PODMU